MRLTIQLGLIVGAIVLLTAGDVAARGGRGGGGGGGRGGGGGMSRPSPSMSRSPAVSRPSAPMSRPSAPVSRPSAPAVSRPSPSRPSAATPPRVSPPAAGARPSAGARPGTGAVARPSTGQLQDFLDIKPGGGAAAPGTRPASRPGTLPGGVAGGAVAGGAIAGGAAADFLQGAAARPGTLPAAGQRPGAGVATRPAAGDRAGLAQRPVAENRAGRIENRQQWQENRVQRRDEIRNQVQENHPRLDFWSDHPGWATWRINRPYRWATWAALTGWVGYGTAEAMPYSYGENVYYQDDAVYYGDQQVASAEEYAQQAEEIVSSAPEVAPEKAEWLPLGVFALTPDGQASGPDPSLFLQLAISKEGVITGTLHNALTNQTQTVEGLADKKSQRCAWTVVGKSRPIMETGIANLTNDTPPALVHFADGQTQQWLMVRLEEPPAGT